MYTFRFQVKYNTFSVLVIYALRILMITWRHWPVMFMLLEEILMRQVFDCCPPPVLVTQLFSKLPLAWENSWHFVTPPLVSPQNDIWETSTEIPYWWHVTTQIWVVHLIGWRQFLANQNRYPHLGSDASSVWNSQPSSFKPVVALPNVGCLLRLSCLLMT